MANIFDILLNSLLDFKVLILKPWKVDVSLDFIKCQLGTAGLDLTLINVIVIQMLKANISAMVSHKFIRVSLTIALVTHTSNSHFILMQFAN